MIYDVAIIGLGPAGIEFAKKSLKKGLKTVAFEKSSVGGTCLNVGCIPTKTMLSCAEVFSKMNYYNKTGILVNNNCELSYQKLCQSRNDIVTKLSTAAEKDLVQKGLELIKSKVELKITKDNVTILANNKEYTAKNTIIACGSKPLSLDLKCNCLIDSDELLQSCNFPSDILIIGSGAIGIEWARLLNSFGSKVTIVEKATSLAPLYDKDVSSRIERMLKIAKINFYKNTVVQDYNDGKAILSNKKEVNCQKILCAIGRKANLPYIHGGIPIEIYENCETNIKNLYVIGDASGIKMLAHAATFQAKALFETIYNNKKFEMPEFPSVIYGMPEIASVGIREQDIKNIDEYKIYKLPILRLPKSWCDNETEGFIKIITKNSYIEGAHIISKEASALISQICIAMKAKMSIDELKNIIFPHPTYSEGIIEALENE